ncbi:MAG: hypothetical protein WBA13_07395 [Microcoleaceae cyanobacterium]
MADEDCSNCAQPELREVKLVNVCPGKKIEITFDVKHIEKEKPPDPPPPPPPPPPAKNHVGIVILLLVSLAVAINCYLEIGVKFRKDIPDFRNDKPRPSIPYCPKPYPSPCH